MCLLGTEHGTCDASASVALVVDVVLSFAFPVSGEPLLILLQRYLVSQQLSIPHPARLKTVSAVEDMHDTTPL